MAGEPSFSKHYRFSATVLNDKVTGLKHPSFLMNLRSPENPPIYFWLVVQRGRLAVPAYFFITEAYVFPSTTLCRGFIAIDYASIIEKMRSYIKLH